jgi:hypothetical protein
LREGDEAAGSRVAALNQIVPFGFDTEGLFDEGDEVFAGSERVSEVGLKLPEEAGT